MNCIGESGKRKLWGEIYRWMIVMVIISLICGAGCHRPDRMPPARAFYYWKSEMKLDESEKGVLNKLLVRKIFVKFFDVSWNKASQSAIPLAKIAVDSSLPPYFVRSNIEIIPTVFITNECFVKLNSGGVTNLAARVNKLVSALIMSNNLTENNIHELQIDCDWTASTRDLYFLFLKEIKSLIRSNNFALSATIRLYQCKYLKKTGVPPVDRGLLMCYNMGNLRDPSHHKNSILDLDDLKAYTERLDEYPLELDVAFPLFAWKVLFRENKYVGLIQNLPDSVLTNAVMAAQTKNIFTIAKDTVVSGYAFKKNDVVRSEVSIAGDVAAAAMIINDHLATSKPTISLYHLDSLILKNYSLHELEDIYNSFR